MDVRLKKYPFPSSYTKKLNLVEDIAIGYLYFIDPEHPLATGAAGRVFHHRHVASISAGRWIETREIVHHDNEDRKDNRPENLELMSNNEHMRLHHGLTRKDPEPITCPVCNKSFVPPSLRSKHCSIGCTRTASRKFEIDAEILRDLVWSMPTTKVVKMLGVSDVAVTRRCKVLGIDKPPRGYWAKKRSGTI